ncbi:MAG: LPS export ABC transporter ATP-binding protein [Candidatus Eiseniibacteriota bacterium]
MIGEPSVPPAGKVASASPGGADVDTATRTSAPVLAASGLVKRYGRHLVVDEVSLSVRPGEVVGLLGPNGAGKTTTFYLIVGLLRPAAGTIRLGDEDLTDLPVYLRARRGIGYLAQEPSIFRKLTVRENILAVLETLGLPRAEQQRRLEELLSELHLTALADRPGSKLSGGERRRVEITRALVTRPRFLLLDEPFVGIDPIAVAEIQDIVQRLKTMGLGMLITDHNVRETLRITDRASIMYQGRILVEGSAEYLATHPEARKFYLGDRFRL